VEACKDSFRTFFDCVTTHSDYYQPFLDMFGGGGGSGGEGEGGEGGGEGGAGAGAAAGDAGGGVAGGS